MTTGVYSSAHGTMKKGCNGNEHHGKGANAHMCVAFITVVIEQMPKRVVATSMLPKFISPKQDGLRIA